VAHATIDRVMTSYVSVPETTLDPIARKVGFSGSRIVVCVDSVFVCVQASILASNMRHIM